MGQEELKCLKSLKKGKQEINIKRTKQAVKTNAKIIAAACPFCNTMLSDGIKATHDNSDIKVLDVAEIIDASVSKERIMIVSFDEISDDARIWIYQSNKLFSNDQIKIIKNRIQDFLNSWTSHGNELKVASKIKYCYFIIIALDQNTSLASGLFDR